jgi:protein phosphatase
MITPEEAYRMIGEAQDKLNGPLLDPRNEDRVVIVGDTHGAVDLTEKVLEKYWDDADLIVFLGDYVDRGNKSVENVGLIASRLLEDPHRTIMLRGNHESPITNIGYGFSDEVQEKLGPEAYDKFRQFFQLMPYAVVVNGYFCVHGGIPMGLEKVAAIANLPRPDVNPDNPIAFQLLWNDPRDMIEEFLPSIRGEGAYYYGTEATMKFLTDNSLKGIIRGHEVVDGFREDMNGHVITVFTSKYHGGKAGVLVLTNDKMEKEIVS